MAVGLLAAPPARAEPETPRPNILVILIDALRADHLGAYGYPRDTSPRIDALAGESIVFGDVYAQSPWTKPSIPTLFTSLYPVQHGVYEGEAHVGGGRLESDVLDDSFTTLAEVFASAGYETLGLVNNAHLEAEGGFAQGFQRYEHGSFTAAEINATFLEFLDARGEGRPFFAYLHYLDAHWPFQPDPSFRARFVGESPEPSLFDRESWKGLRERINDASLQLSEVDRARLQDQHDGGVGQIDHRLGELFDALRARGVFEDTILLLTSDHGEELLDHGAVGHGGTLYREVIEIPLMIRLPGGVGAQQSPRVARLLDVLPTLAVLAGVEAPAEIEGRDLFAPAPAPPEIVAETRHKRTYRLSIREGDWKYVRTYRAKLPKSAAPRDPKGGVAIPLEPGIRVKVRGFLLGDGSLEATKLTRKDAGDDDLEISASIESISEDKKAFGLLGRTIQADDLMNSDGTPALEVLVQGIWVKVEGEVEEGGVVAADKFKLLAPGDRNDEVELIVERVEAVGDDGEIKLEGSGFVIRVTEDTRLKGFGDGPVRVVERVLEPAPDFFTPARLLAPGAPPFDEQLFDLASDPSERADRMKSSPEEASRLGASLNAWLARMEKTAAGQVDRRALDSDTIEHLKELGYIE
ncbi:MAG: sulfatase [Myxococcota bacterium]|nr:sulfatase [Myxococcota bacterium]